jgi:3-dehydroquinate synthase
VSAGEPMRVAVGTRQRDYDVLVGRGLIGRLGELVEAAGPQAVVVTDTNVARHHLDPVVAALEARALTVTRVVVPAGEREKNPGRLAEIYERLYALGVGRDDLVVALGGGVVGDLAGYAADTYLRGLRLVQVPTTLLAMVDASVGGKVAVDFHEGKNHLGTFYQPWLVVADLDTLSTLPAAELPNGWAEAVKHGFLAGGGLLELTAAALEAGEPTVDLVAGSVRLKAAVVGSDEREETGRRARLNLGHTLGHAIEAAGGFETWPHGAAVGLGLRAALWLSLRLTGLDSASVSRGQELLTRAGAPERLEGVPVEQVLGLVARDKKAVAGRARFVLLQAFGDPVGGIAVPEETQREVLEWLTRR